MSFGWSQSKPVTWKACCGASDPRIGIYLVYGPDIGLVNERAKIVAERAVDDPADPFQLIRLDGDDIAGDPGRLADEAGTMGLFGGKRALWIRATSRNIAPAIDAVLKNELQDTIIVVEAGDLAKTSPLRNLVREVASGPWRSPAMRIPAAISARSSTRR